MGGEFENIVKITKIPVAIFAILSVGSIDETINAGVAVGSSDGFLSDLILANRGTNAFSGSLIRISMYFSSRKYKGSLI